MDQSALTENGGRLGLRDLYLYKKASAVAEERRQPSDLHPLMAGIAIWMGVIALLWLIG